MEGGDHLANEGADLTIAIRDDASPNVAGAATAVERVVEK
jgi:hypothetical protein